MLEISHSSCSTARSCKKKYHWKYVEGYHPIRKSNALTLGEVLHEAFDKFYKGLPDMEVYKFISEKTAEQLASASLTEQEDIYIIGDTLLAMWHNYPHKDKSEFETILSELEFKVPFGKDTMFVGKTDRLVKKDGKWWVGELKSSGLPFQAFRNRIAVSDQPTAYVYAWKQKGYDVQGVIYDYIQKPLLRKGRSETCHEYCKRITQDYSINNKKYYNRHYEYRGDDDVRRWINDTERLAEDMRLIRNGGYAYRNPDSCYLYNSECPYKKICFTDKPDQLTLDLYFEKR